MRPVEFPRLPPGSVLLLETSEPSRQVYERVLGAWGLRVTSVTTGGEAIRALKAGSFTLLLSRTGLPDMHGFELMRIAAERFGTPGMALSGIADADYVRRSLEAGFSRHIVMPVRLAELHATIRDFLLESAATQGINC